MNLSEKEKTSPQYIFADESWIEIEDKKHLIIGGLATKEPGILARQLISLKSMLNLEPFDEIKWNSPNYTQEERNRLSEGMISIVRQCTGLLSIVEGTDRQKAMEFFASQVIEYCADLDSPDYLLALDHGLIPKPDKLREFVSQSDSPTCIGIHILDSRYDQGIQCADVFIGLFRAAIRQKLGAELKSIPNTDESFDGIRDSWLLTEYVTFGTRGMLWGKMDQFNPERGFVYYEHPMHRAAGLGFRLHSSVSEEVRSRLENDIATVYMGCIH